MPLFVRDGGTWKAVATPAVRDGGTWKAVQAVWVRDGGTWKQVSSGGTGGFGPSAAPSAVSRYLYNTTRIGVSWTNGDATAASNVYRRATINDNWVLVASAVAGATSAETGFTSGFLFGVSHVKSGQETAIIQEDGGGA